MKNVGCVYAGVRAEADRLVQLWFGHILLEPQTIDQDTDAKAAERLLGAMEVSSDSMDHSAASENVGTMRNKRVCTRADPWVAVPWVGCNRTAQTEAAAGPSTRDSAPSARGMVHDHSLNPTQHGLEGGGNPRLRAFLEANKFTECDSDSISTSIKCA